MVSKRIQIPFPGDWYFDLLTIDAAINGRSVPVQSQSLLCAKLQERETKIKERVQYMAEKRGISYEQCWRLLLSGGDYEPDKSNDMEQ